MSTNQITRIWTRSASKLLRVLQAVFITLAQVLAMAQGAQPVSAVAGSYSLKWYAADPAVNRQPYLPTYTKVPPSQKACPTPSGGVGRAADPMKDAVAYGTSFASNQLDAVTSLAPKDLALGQIVPFEMEITVKGSTTPENGVIQFTSGFNTHTTSGDNFGFDPIYMVYCAFVDTADKGTIDPGANAKVDSWASTLANPGGGSSEEIQGTFQISGLDDGDNVIVEIWVVLKPTIPPGSGGNVQTRLIDAHTVATTPDAISTGNQTVPLLQVKDFFSNKADVSITKSDSPDPVVLGNQLTYTIVATNNSLDIIANGVIVSDTLDPNTTFVSGTWQPTGTCTAAAGVVTCNIGALAQGSSVTITVVVTVKTSAPTAGTVQTGICTVGAPGVDLCNIATVVAVTSDPDTANNSASAPTNVIGTPVLSLTKTATPSTYSAVGQTINYSYILKNTGNVTLSYPFAVADDKATDETCPSTPATLAPNATLTCTASYSITQADLDAGSVTNKATATAKFNENTVTSDEATATVTAVKSPALSLTKSAAPSTYDTVGQVISYSYVIKNTGNVTMAGPFTVADDKASDESCPATSSLAPGATITCSASYTITQTDLDASKVTNKAIATNGIVTSNEATATVYAVAHPNLSLVKTATPAKYSKVGDLISYSYEVKNIGNVALSGPFAVTDDKATVNCPQPASLAVGASITCTASYAITQADLDAGSVTNHAMATATFGGNAVTSNQSQATVNAEQTRALTLDKIAQEATYAHVGDVLHYDYLVTNSGNVTLHDAITISDNKTTATCPALPAGGLAPGASITCTASYTIQQSDLDAGSVTNVASATSGTTTSNTDTETVKATQSPALYLVKTASPATYSQAGQSISYTYDLTNSGNVTLSGPFAVTDDMASVTCPSIPSLAVGDTLTCSASHTVTQAEVDAGSITNHATATATFGGNPVTSNEATAIVTANQTPALLLVKTATPTTYVTVGDVISYSYLLTNSGNVTLVGPFTVADDKATADCPATASLAPDESITCNASYTITQADLDAGSVKNTATGHAKFGNTPVDSNEASQTVTAIQQGGLGLTKTATPLTYSKVGDVVSYSYGVQNTGNITLAGPFTVNDDKVGAVSCPAGSLAPNATVFCTASYTIAQADLDAGSVTNHATATDGTLTSNEAQTTVTANQSPKLAIDKSATESIYDAVGDVIQYSYLVTNTGNVTLHAAIVVSDDKAADESCPALPAEGLAPGVSISCTASYTITQADLDAGSLTNVASAASGTTVSPTDTVTVPANQSPALTLKKSANPMTYTTLGQTITYDYLLTNSGNVTLSSPFAVTDDKATVTCPATVTSLAPGDTLNCTASYTITQADLDSGKVTNVATATAKFGDTTVTSNQDTATITAVQSPALVLDKTANPSTYDAVGDVISYSYKLTNSGNVTLVGPFTVGDNKATVTCPTDSSLVPGASITCSSSYTITQADLDGGSVTNTATGHAAFGGNTIDSNPDSETVNAVQAPALSLVKSASPATYDHVGQSITYSYVLTNIGNVTLAGSFTVSDDKATVTCPADATLAVGASITCSATYQITQADLDTGSVTNTATGHGQTLGGTPVNSNDANATVNAEQKPALAIDKTAKETTYATAGDVIHYSYLVTNTGNVTLHDEIVVSDDKSTATCPALPAEGLAPGVSIVCTASYIITQADLDAGSLTNVASAASGTTVSPTDTVTIPASLTPALSLIKAATPQFIPPVKVGDKVNYTLTATNTGNVTLSNVTINDAKLGTLGCTPIQPAELAPGATLVCTGSYAITQSDIDAGHVANTALATSTLPGGGEGPGGEDSNDVPVPQSPALQLTKAATPHFSTPVKVGDTIDYTLTAANIGNVTLTNVSISDAKLGTLTCTPPQPATLAPGATLVCSGSYAIQQADIDAGHVANTAFATSTLPGGGGGPGGQDTEDVPVPQTPALAIDKTASPTTYSKPGDVIAYSYKVTNTGNMTLHDAITVTDTKVTVTCPDLPAGGLAPGAFITCSASYTIQQSDLDAGSITNSAFAKSGSTQSNTDTETVTAVQTPALMLVKTADPATYSAVSQTISYTYVIKNTGNITLSGPFSVTDDKSPVTCTQPADGALSPDETMNCSASYTITQPDLDAGSVINKATATNGTVTSNEATATVTAVQSPALSLTKSASPATYSKVGDVISYTFVAKNSGNVTLPGPFSISDNKLGTISCPTGSLVPNATVTCTASYTIKQSDLDSGSIKNTATASTIYDGKTVTSGPADATVTAVQSPALSLTKSATPATYSAVSQTISYSYTLTNTGNVTLSSPFAVTDNKATVTCPSTPTTLAPIATLTCIASYTITQADLDAGSLTNTATATAKFGNSTVTSNLAEATVTATQSPAITLTKTASATTYSKVGDVISYTLVAKNTGNVTLHDVSISDPKLGALTCTQPVTLVPNATLTCTGTYTIQASDLVAGQPNKVTNTATVNGKGPQDQPVSATATANVYQQTAALLPTQTTCQMYAAGPSAWPAMYDSFLYQVKANKISSVSPGVIFYYNTITAPSASFTLTVVESNTLSWKPMLIQDLGQAILYNASCSKAGGVTVTAGGTNPYTVTFTVTGATPGATYYIGIKYSPQNLVGQSVSKSASKSTYSFATTGYIGSGASILVQPKSTKAPDWLPASDGFQVFIPAVIR